MITAWSPSGVQRSRSRAVLWEVGESVVSLARWLGHSDPGFTLRKYAHFPPRAGARGSTAIDAVFA